MPEAVWSVAFLSGPSHMAPRPPWSPPRWAEQLLRDNTWPMCVCLGIGRRRCSLGWANRGGRSSHPCNVRGVSRSWGWGPRSCVLGGWGALVRGRRGLSPSSLACVVNHREPTGGSTSPGTGFYTYAFHPVFFHRGDPSPGYLATRLNCFPPYPLVLLAKRTLEMSCHVNTI